MADQEASTHFNWIGIISDRLICAKQQNLELALLSLSFLENNNLPDFSNIERPQFPITVEKLSDAKFYSIIVSALVAHKKSNPNKELFNSQNASFNSVLSELSNESYFPQKPCDSEGLENCNVEHHINLCRSIEYFVLDNAISIDLLTSDLRHLPRSFFVLPSNITIDLLEDAISLWLSKFHCNIHFNEEAKIEPNSNNQPEMNEKLYHVQLDTSKFAKVAACLARIFPKEINKQDIKKGDNEEEVEHNKKLSCVILNELHAFVPNYFPVDERLFVLFIADLYYATRSGVKRFVKVDAPPPPQFDIHLPQNNLIIKPPTSGFSIRKQISQSPSAPLQIAQLPASPLQFAQQTRGSQGKFISQPKIIKPKVDRNGALSKQKRQNKAKVEKDKKAKPKLENKLKIIAEPIVLGDNQIIELAEDEIDQSGVVLNDLDDTENLEKYGFNYLDPNGFDKDIVYNGETSDQNSEKDQVDKKKKCLEFPELELLLQQLIEKKPENGPYYNKLYDTFLLVMKQSMIINYPDVAEIFNFTKSTFEKLLRNEELDYDFEEVITNMLQKYKNQSGSDNQNSSNKSNQDNQLDIQEKEDGPVKGKSDNSKIPKATNKKSQKSVQNKARCNKDGADQIANEDSKINPDSRSNNDDINERNQDGSDIQTSENNVDPTTNQNTNCIKSNKVSISTQGTNNNDKLQSITNNENQENSNYSQQNKDSNTLQSNSRNSNNSTSESNDKLLSGNDINNQDGNTNDERSTSTNNDNNEQATQKNDEHQGSKTSEIQASKNTDCLQVVGNTIDSLTSSNNSRATNENTHQLSTTEIESKLQNRSSTDDQNNLEASTTNKINDGNASNSVSNHENDLNGQNPIKENEEEDINQNENYEINEDATSNQNGNNELNEGDNSRQNDNEVDTSSHNQNSETNVKAHSNVNRNDVANSTQKSNEEVNDVDNSNKNVNNEINQDNDSKQENNEEANSNEKENDLTNQDGYSSQEDNEEVNQEDNSNQNGNTEAEDDGITDDMILREAENMISLKKTGKLKQLSSAISSSSKDRSKRASTVPNYQTIVNALKFTSMPQPKYKPVLNEIIDMLQDFKEERILLLMASRTRKFKGIYVLISDDLSAMKLWGQGPNDIKNQDVGAFYKYINGQKTFEQIATKSFTQTTDGFSMKKNLEKKTW